MPDDISGPQVHFLYIVPSDGGDGQLDTSGVISVSVASWQAWLRGQTGGRGLRLDTYHGELDITFLRFAGAFEGRRSLDVIRAAGFNDPTKIYAVVWDGGAGWSACGASWASPPFGILILRGTPPGGAPCALFPLGGNPLGYSDFAMLHEIGHALGYVQLRPHYTSGRGPHVSDSRFDLMYTGNEPWGVNDWRRMELDVGRDNSFFFFFFFFSRADLQEQERQRLLSEPRTLRKFSVAKRRIVRPNTVRKRLCWCRRAAVAAVAATAHPADRRRGDHNDRGSAYAAFSDAGPAISARLNYPRGVAVDGKGNVYIADLSNLRIRKVSPSGRSRRSPATADTALQGRRPCHSLREAVLPVCGGGDRQGTSTSPTAARMTSVTPSCARSAPAGRSRRLRHRHSGFLRDGGPATAAQLSWSGWGGGGREGQRLHLGRVPCEKVSPGGTITTIAGTGKTGFSGTAARRPRRRLVR